MLGIMRAAQRDREEQERQRQRAAWRRTIAQKYDVSADLTSSLSHSNFCHLILRNLAQSQIPQALIDLDHTVIPRSRPTWFCRIFGCVPRDRCNLRPYCTDCQGRCIRCGIGVVPRGTRVNSP